MAVAPEASTSAKSHGFKYDAFLSFRGEDIRTTFTAHLFQALKAADLEQFMDDDGIKRGNTITSELEEAIQNSRVPIIIFSEHYASSSWCLNELLYIFDHYRSKSKTHGILPLFYHLNKQQLDEHMSLMEAQFADHFGAIDDQLAEMKESISDLPNLKNSIDQMKGELPEVRHSLAELQSMIHQLIEGRGMGMEGRKKGEEEGSTSKQSRQGKGFEDSHKDYFQQTNVHFEAQAEYWFGAYIKARGRVLWPVFVRDITARFAKLFKESVIGEFHKLRQVGTVEQYYNEFETLRSIMVNEGCKFDDSYFTHSFISGLKDEIRLEVDKFEVYDVLLSYESTDIHENFIELLDGDLSSSKFRTSKAENNWMDREEDGTSELDAAISRSMSSIIVFSRNYAYSPRCLDQLLKIFEYISETKRLVIIPVFYQVSKDQIRMQAERLAALLPGMYKKQFKREKIVEAIEEKADRRPRKLPPSNHPL
ncbi:hypothetical protein RJ640_001006 [Escallonia rubra]|uniref:ADP-ribosyl cyclase/cyclic ADP-ribose hydrolase n=1 Tax=Escallonia rubra TaxID=112253 RepID=A0AA88RJ34_9ASTE|nr:hypothetical protein RJ640_001006 [Escallonia rubra]